MASIEINKLNKNGEIIRKIYLDFKANSNKISTLFNNNPQEDVFSMINSCKKLENIESSVIDNFIWRYEVVVGLLCLRKEIDILFQEKKTKRSHLWTSISKKLNNIFNVTTTHSTCYDKFQHLMKCYRRNKEKHMSDQKIYWKYFHVCEQLFGDNGSADIHFICPKIFEYEHNKLSHMPSVVSVDSNSCNDTSVPGNIFNGNNFEDEKQSYSTKKMFFEDEEYDSNMMEDADVYLKFNEKKNKLMTRSLEIEKQKLKALSKLDNILIKLQEKNYFS